MSAGKNFGGVVNGMLAKVFENVEGELLKEGEIPGSVHDQNLPGTGGEALHVGHGADAAEQIAKKGLGKACVFKRFAEMPRALPGPKDVSEPGCGVVEGGDLQTRIVRSCDEGVTGTERGAKNTELLIPLLFKPIQAGAYIDDALLTGGDGTAEIGRDRIVGAFELSGTTNVMVGLRKAQTGDAEPIEDRAKRIVRKAVGIPLRHDDHGLERLVGCS